MYSNLVCLLDIIFLTVIITGYVVNPSKILPTVISPKSIIFFIVTLSINSFLRFFPLLVLKNLFDVMNDKKPPSLSR